MTVFIKLMPELKEDNYTVYYSLDLENVLLRIILHMENQDFIHMANLKEGKDDLIYWIHHVMEPITNCIYFARIGSIDENSSEVEKLKPYIRSRKSEVMEKKHLIEYAYARCQESLGNIGIAIKFYKKAEERCPSFMDITERIEILSTSNSKRKVKKKVILDPYKILGIPPTSNIEETKAAYKEKLKENHPDKVSHMSKDIQKLAEQKTQEIINAYKLIEKAAA